MSAREGLAAALAGHRQFHNTETGDSRCECGEWTGPFTRLPDDDPRAHAAHLADVILRDWLPGALADERVVEAAAKALYAEDENASVGFEEWPEWGSDDNVARHAWQGNATAALTAAVTVLTEEDA